MIRTTILASCVLGLCSFALAQPTTNVHQQKQTATTQTADTTKKAEVAAPAKPNMYAADFTMGKVQCPAGVHYFVGYNPCVPPSPWTPQPGQ